MGGVESTENSFDWEGAETRPLISSERIEQGKDYWLDEGERKDFEERERAIKNRKEMEGEISKDKLKEEVREGECVWCVGVMAIENFFWSVPKVKGCHIGVANPPPPLHHRR